MVQILFVRFSYFCTNIFTMNTRTINITEFRDNLKTYLLAAKEARIKVHSPKAGSFYIIPADLIDDANYNPKFVKKILTGEKNRKEGKAINIDVNDLWK